MTATIERESQKNFAPPTLKDDDGIPGDWMPYGSTASLNVIEPDSDEDANFLAYEDCLPWELKFQRATKHRAWAGRLKGVTTA